LKNLVEPYRVEKKVIMSAENNGGKTIYYDVPEGAETLNDLIEHKDMPFWRGEIFKAAYRINGKDNTTEERELNKIIYYANRGLNAAKKKRK
jgi:hypothetical protein